MKQEKINELKAKAFDIIAKGKKVWFKWSNGDLQRIYIYREFKIKGEICYRAKMGCRSFVIKSSQYGKTWALTKEELE